MPGHEVYLYADASTINKDFERISQNTCIVNFHIASYKKKYTKRGYKTSPHQFWFHFIRCWFRGREAEAKLRAQNMDPPRSTWCRSLRPSRPGSSQGPPARSRTRPSRTCIPCPTHTCSVCGHPPLPPRPSCLLSPDSDLVNLVERGSAEPSLPSTRSGSSRTSSHQGQPSCGAERPTSGGPETRSPFTDRCSTRSSGRSLIFFSCRL